MTLPFELSSKYYELLYSDKDTEGEVEYLHRKFCQHGLNIKRVLELGSGTGRHASLLASKGYQVHGIELSQAMVSAVKKVDGFTCEQGDITSFNLDQSFDAIISIFHVVSYITLNKDLKSMFANVSKHLCHNGLFVFDFWYTPAVLELKPSIRIKRLCTDKIKITRIAEPQLKTCSNVVEVNYEIFIQDQSTGACEVITENHPMRHFSLPEIDLLASWYGFERVIAEEWLTSEPPSNNTWGVCVTYKKL